MIKRTYGLKTENVRTESTNPRVRALLITNYRVELIAQRNGQASKYRPLCGVVVKLIELKDVCVVINPNDSRYGATHTSFFMTKSPKLMCCIYTHDMMICFINGDRFQRWVKANRFMSRKQVFELIQTRWPNTQLLMINHAKPVANSLKIGVPDLKTGSDIKRWLLQQGRAQVPPDGAHPIYLGTSHRFMKWVEANRVTRHDLWDQLNTRWPHLLDVGIDDRDIGSGFIMYASQPIARDAIVDDLVGRTRRPRFQSKPTKISLPVTKNPELELKPPYIHITLTPQLKQWLDGHGWDELARRIYKEAKCILKAPTQVPNRCGDQIRIMVSPLFKQGFPWLRDGEDIIARIVKS